MSQRVSGYIRKLDELYETPAWLIDVLIPHLPSKPRVILEPAAGSGRMVQALANALGPRIRIYAPDVDFLTLEASNADAIITNPPYGFGGRLAVKFIEKALSLVPLVAMLLRVDFDSAKGRAHIFADHPAWAKKLVLRRRVMWFPSETGHGPSENHAWYIWNRDHSGPPEIAYGP